MLKTWIKVLLFSSGILMIVAGIYAIFHPNQTLVSMSLILGLLMFFSGVCGILTYGGIDRRVLGSGWILFDGILSIVVAMFFLGNNLVVAGALPFIFGIWILFSGIEKIIHACDMNKLGFAHWWVTLALGILCAGTGLLSFFRPIVGMIAISLIIGFSLVFHGIATLSLWYVGRDN